MLTTKPTIGCVIPARNEAGYLKELINEILSIDKLDELIIVEGCDATSVDSCTLAGNIIIY